MKTRPINLLLYLIALLPFFSGAQILQNDLSEPYPYQNPVIRHMYTADAAPHVMPDGKVWMVTSVDSMEGGGYSTMHRYHLFSSSNMRDWQDHGEVFHIDQLRPAATDSKEQMWAAWAPDMVYRNGKYYLYIPVRILFPQKTRPNGGRYVESYLAVAETDTLGKRFELVNPKIQGTRGIDPAVFIDDDGRAYIYWGSQWAAELKPNMTELASEPIQLDVGTDRFMEAAWMNKRGDTYYLSYHTKYDWQLGITAENLDDPGRKKSELAYSVGKSPMGPFVYAGILNYELGVGVQDGPRHPDGDFVPWRLTQSNHGGIVEYHGQEYLFYHTSALSSWFQTRFQDKGTWTQRSVCVDLLNYDDQGNVIPVQQTLTSVPPVQVNQPFEIDLTQHPIAQTHGLRWEGKQLHLTAPTAWMKLEGVDLGSGYYFYEAQIETMRTPLKVELRKGSPSGQLMGTAAPHHSEQRPATVLLDTPLRGANGLQDLYIVFVSEGAHPNVRLTVNSSRIFAGSPSTSKK
jgi:arabinoxylan arabinofuranohydrolase